MHMTSATGVGPAAFFRQKTRIDWVDYAKGICILLVVMMHSTLGVEKAAGDTGWLGYVVEFSRPFRMPDFFLISGLFLGLVIDRPWLRYFDRKVVHFLYFYVLWLTIQFAFKAPGWIAEGLSPAELAGRYFLSFVEPFGTLWFIYMLPVFFIVTRLTKQLPWWSVLGFAALLEILPVHTGWLMVDEFAARYVYFLAGYLFAGSIFALADRVRQNGAIALALLAVWALVNALIVFAPVAPSVQAVLGISSYSNLPIVSLMLGGMGALAIICGSVLLSKLPWTGFLEYLGRNSIVVYLAFFLPMAISRAVLLKFAPFLDIGSVSALVMLAAASGPVLIYWGIQWTGHGRFLFHRPAWAWLDRSSAPQTRASLRPAE
ncbi:acyltransferase family protein [Salaquimonas pukyongi]|uniref:acyltransferase family protein n=1 Tax=Salaquimonas pukyongi TaxID=2712698 RepID=UPI001FCD3CEE|nr:acyltransferase family protein [Salaquimonas pukyongi]